MDQEKVGKFIKKLRLEKNLTQQEFGSIFCVTYQAVSKWENGKNMPDITQLRKICEYFKVDINDLLDGQKTAKKSYFKYFIIVIILIIMSIFVFMFFKLHNVNHDFEFKELGTTCKEFEISGSAAYNSDKTSLYISKVNYCGTDEERVYSNIQCNLYESYNINNTLISNCGSENSITLKDFLEQLKIKVDDYSAICSTLPESNLYLEIIMSAEEMKSTTYKIPLTLNDDCDN